ncbi:hypothetical protein D8M06_01720 [Oceanobacillus halophilus]|uniref:Uncharacterized protein n=1 Tax=Oceanobacillus halophilus TaxID=930130 RepID=A0A495AC36_9BACI|nr:hypothetical protein D8M06_01720 [Oceanobacillus halophilus]
MSDSFTIRIFDLAKWSYIWIRTLINMYISLQFNSITLNYKFNNKMKDGQIKTFHQLGRFQNKIKNLIDKNHEVYVE